MPADELNFVKFKKILMTVVPKYLRQLFKEQWNRKYQDQQWESSYASGTFLLKEISEKMKDTTSLKLDLKYLRTGNEQEWDAATLIFIMLDSCLDLGDDHSIREDIKMLKDIESSFFGDGSKASMSSKEFVDKIKTIKSIARRIFEETAVVEVNNIENSPEERKMKIKLEQLLNKARSRKGKAYQSDKVLEKGIFFLLDVFSVKYNCMLLVSCVS